VVVVTLNASAAYRARDGSKDQIEEDAACRVLQCMSLLVALTGGSTMSAPTSARGGKAEMLRTAPIRRS
jgi:hypothetical protein